MIPYSLLRPLLFRLPAETAHEVATAGLVSALAAGPVRAVVRRQMTVDDPRLRIRRWGIDFPNPVGLAAGFDKAATAFNALAALGFGFVEVGTVTALAQEGNPRPRLFRLPEDRALLNRMGFNNDGAEAVARRLRGTTIEPVLGVNLGKSKATPLEEAPGDYLRSLELLEPFARYLVVNVSSPNTPGLRALQDAGPLRALLSAMRRRTAELARERGAEPAPILVKIAPDLTDPQVDEAVDIAREEGVSGIVATNTTISREGLATPRSRLEELGAGGISGAPVRRRAEEVVARIYRRTGGELPVVGVGGIFDAEDAWRRIRAGASLLQLYTGFVYGGPEVVQRINRGLLLRVERAGLSSLDEAVGLDHR